MPSEFVSNKTGLQLHVLCENCYLKELINCEIRGSHRDAILAGSVGRTVNYFYRKTKSRSGRKKSCRMQILSPDLWSSEVLIWVAFHSLFAYRTVTKLQARNQPPLTSDIITRKWWERILFVSYFTYRTERRLSFTSQRVKGDKTKRKELVILMEMSDIISRAGERRQVIIVLLILVYWCEFVVRHRL
jgi:hypothetical protein